MYTARRAEEMQDTNEGMMEGMMEGMTEAAALGVPDLH